MKYHMEIIYWFWYRSGWTQSYWVHKYFLRGMKGWAFKQLKDWNWIWYCHGSEGYELDPEIMKKLRSHKREKPC